MADVGLDHAAQPVAVAETVVEHRKIARLKDVERHLAARQQQRARQREYRNHLGQLAGPVIFGIDRHLRPAVSAGFKATRAENPRRESLRVTKTGSSTAA